MSEDRLRAIAYDAAAVCWWVYEFEGDALAKIGPFPSHEAAIEFLQERADEVDGALTFERPQ
jgi:hypothetical protein